MTNIDLLTLRRDLTKVVESLPQTGPVGITKYGKVVAFLSPVVDAFYGAGNSGNEYTVPPIVESREAPKRKKPTFTVSKPVEHGFTVQTTTSRASGMKAAREALEAAKQDRSFSSDESDLLSSRRDEVVTTRDLNSQQKRQAEIDKLLHGFGPKKK